MRWQHREFRQQLDAEPDPKKRHKLNMDHKERAKKKLMKSTTKMYDIFKMYCQKARNHRPARGTPLHARGGSTRCI